MQQHTLQLQPPTSPKIKKRTKLCALKKNGLLIAKKLSHPHAFSSPRVYVAHCKGELSTSTPPSIRRFLAAVWFHVHQQHQEALNQTPTFWHNCSDFSHTWFRSTSSVQQTYLKYSPECSVTEHYCCYSLQLVCSHRRTTKCATGIHSKVVPGTEWEILQIEQILKE